MRTGHVFVLPVLVWALLFGTDSAQADAIQHPQAWLSWSTTSRQENADAGIPGSARPLYLHIANAPPFSALAIEVVWTPRDSSGGYIVYSDSTESEASGWWRPVACPAEFNGATAEYCPLQLTPGPNLTVRMLVRGDGSPATICLRSAQLNDVQRFCIKQQAGSAAGCRTGGRGTHGPGSGARRWSSAGDCG